ncbi:hypothetical protein GSI_09884 [Ganoderma sinense ZZ0214-1]|uniref:Uncharacterized protein n=1 Tax=Ganoderma sinense ZZ0214-1 TaxID=1077348 RepID=A0A2G8S2M3_9APHY|nr:hypothetical protein GSI_09884 [Ganoderma sinense ZZ0214-1]
MSESRLPSLDEATQYLPVGDQNARSLYGTLLLPAEDAAMAAGNKVEVIYSRVVGYLLLHPPSEAARATVTLELASCNKDGEPFLAVYGLGAMYLKLLIQIFKKTRGRTPVPSYHSSRHFFDPIRDDYLQNVRATPRDHSSAKAAGLVRDDYRCMLTDGVDEKYGTILPDDDSPTTRTWCCHIFPDSLGNNNQVAVGGTGAEERQVATVWTILEQFGYGDVCDQLKPDTEGTNLHRMENVMTLDMVVHERFDDLRLWLEEVPDKLKPTFNYQRQQRDCYYVRLAEPLTHRSTGMPERVQFVAHSDHPLPSPRFLQIHAACCRVAHLAGAAEHLDEILDEGEGMKVLDPDGSSARALEYYLLRCGSRPVPSA